MRLTIAMKWLALGATMALAGCDSGGTTTGTTSVDGATAASDTTRLSDASDPGTGADAVTPVDDTTALADASTETAADAETLDDAVAPTDARDDDARPPRPDGDVPPPTPDGDGPRFDMAQTLSDGAQRTTLAFSGLALMTGNLAAQSFFPPGKVADYTGFQYLRDNDPDDMGHNTSFLTRIAYDVIVVLDDDQFATLRDLAVSQQASIDRYAYLRYPLMQAFRRLLDGTAPAGTDGLSLDAVKAASRELYLVDGQLAFDRAKVYADLLATLSSTQVAWLDAMKGKGFSSWPDTPKEAVDPRMKSLPRGSAVAVMTYASDLFSWYAGSIEADVYFCPERHGTYYGGFYIKDAPAVGHEGYGIDEQLTNTAGSALSDASKGYVTTAQATLMSSLVGLQRDNLYARGDDSIVGVRTRIATLLRSLLVAGADADAVESEVLGLSARYGELDGENNYHYATVFAAVWASLSAAQRDALMQLRRDIMSGTYADGTPFDFTVCETPYLYSSPITDPTTLTPWLDASDDLFAAP